MATLRRRSESYFVDYRINGRRFRKKVGPSKRIAELALKDIEVKIAKGELGFSPKDNSLAKLFEEFLKYSKINHAPSTFERYRGILDNFKSFLVTRPYINKISQLDPKFFEDYKHFRKSEEVEDKTVNIELQMLRGMFNLARGWRYCADNPTEGVRFFKITKTQEPRFLSKKECEKLLNNCTQELYQIFFTFLNTGMRRGELLNLEWRDVDLTRKRIKIRAKEDWQPKTSERYIPMNDSLFKVLRKHRESSKGGLVFANGDGKKIHKNDLRKELMKITEKCGFPDVTKLHSLRHTFASHLVMSGVDLPTVKKLMGHSDIDTTMIYSHLADEHVDRAVEKLVF
ncbi:site-specific integrase [Patescibacteria group bacterium]|nr:site-specific integrase [Patescibacteria group bacterium]